MNWKPWLLPLVTGATLGMIHVLPKAGDTASSAAGMELPGFLGAWELQRQAASESEIKTLGAETAFSKALCLKSRWGELGPGFSLVKDRIDLSIVLSGSDLNTSIHRPERCMPAQGHVLTDSRKVRIAMDGGRSFDARRLLSVKSEKSPEAGGEAVDHNCVTYYFFVGHDRVTHDHLERTFIDMKDRLVRGMDQRWAYVSATMKYGKLAWIGREVSEAEADAKLREFLADLAARQIDWGRVVE